MDILLFVLAVSGITIILNKSALFKPVREYVSSKYVVKYLDIRDKNYGLQKTNKLWWFPNALFTCHTCMSVWIGILAYSVKYNSVNIDMFLYSFSATAFTTVLFSLIQMLDRK